VKITDSVPDEPENGLEVYFDLKNLVGTKVNEGYIEKDYTEVECNYDSFLDLAKDSNNILVTQHMEYRILSNNETKLIEKIYVFLLTDSGILLWSKTWENIISEWNEEVFEERKILIVNLNFEDIKTSGWEKIEVTSGYCESDVNAWNVTLTIRNTGASYAILSGALVNGREISEYGSGNIVAYDGKGAAINWNTGVSLSSGTSAKLIVVINKSPNPSTAYSFSAGTTVEVSLLSSAGNSYMKMVTLT